MYRFAKTTERRRQALTRERGSSALYPPTPPLRQREALPNGADLQQVSLPVRVLKQGRLHHIHIGLCQLGATRTTIKSTVSDSGNMEIDPGIQVRAQTHTRAASTAVKLA